ncbi:hypothetical protein B0H16DRAFT_1009198 [Mycena metata]|uniref:Uncharacterized protein n=1 Tax=Mycena metata TaxID=1033252 RepID=A0AAD7DEC9_9AGAR|nr:hypothetical protein B0H16DRAFT_1009198 [Mycena metata]
MSTYMSSRRVLSEANDIDSTRIFFVSAITSNLRPAFLLKHDHNTFTPPPSQTTSYSIMPDLGAARVLRLRLIRTILLSQYFDHWRWRNARPVARRWNTSPGRGYDLVSLSVQASAIFQLEASRPITRSPSPAACASPDPVREITTHIPSRPRYRHRRCLSPSRLSDLDSSPCLGIITTNTRLACPLTFYPIPSPSYIHPPHPPHHQGHGECQKKTSDTGKQALRRAKCGLGRAAPANSSSVLLHAPRASGARRSTNAFQAAACRPRSLLRADPTSNLVVSALFRSSNSCGGYSRFKYFISSS